MSDVNILLAQVRNPLMGSGFASGSDYFSSVISTVINILFIVATVIFVFIFIIGAFQWITSGSDREKLAEARGRITHAIIGLLILLLIFLIAKFVNALLGIDVGFLGGLGSSSDCSSICQSVNPAYPQGYCASGVNPTPNPGCINSNQDCQNPLRDCMCCPLGTSSVSTAPTATSPIALITIISSPSISSPTPTAPITVITSTSSPTSTPIPTTTRLPPTNTPIPTAIIIPSNTPIPTASSTITPIPTAVPTTSSAFCRDTDSGFDPLNFGIVSENTQIPGVTQDHADYCLSSMLNEYACRIDNVLVMASYVCGNVLQGSICLRGECCYDVGTTCSTNGHCCSPYTCQGGVCSPASNIILNEGSGQSCRNLCAASGFLNPPYCVSIGTNSVADNGLTMLNGCSETTIYSCGNPILLSNSIALCSGHMTNWTYCNCVPNAAIN